MRLGSGSAVLAPPPGTYLNRTSHGANLKLLFCLNHPALLASKRATGLQPPSQDAPNHDFPLLGSGGVGTKEIGASVKTLPKSRATPKHQIPPGPGKPPAPQRLPWPSASPLLKGTVTSLPALQPEQARLPGRAGSCLMLAWTQTQLSLEASPPPPAHSFHPPSFPPGS